MTLYFLLVKVCNIYEVVVREKDLQGTTGRLHVVS